MIFCQNNLFWDGLLKFTLNRILTKDYFGNISLSCYDQIIERMNASSSKVEFLANLYSKFKDMKVTYYGSRDSHVPAKFIQWMASDPMIGVDLRNYVTVEVFKSDDNRHFC